VRVTRNPLPGDGGRADDDRRDSLKQIERADVRARQIGRCDADDANVAGRLIGWIDVMSESNRLSDCHDDSQ
jgi:hypothetical protein